ncbi:NUDIX hydrolase [Photobacterium atrarenae]|uniref:8-oxo-dGTP diphosphatase n=1 Tax=Photobacterium atrarenae TaxID=865757 RepID=A0ABY5GN16_9GAMM|nr:NUDIX domain-containing protein [Photobacterium atrarenae]UTV30541.1 NUDIX domain-containing protein [Photobacterium atrarenae]
MKAHECVSFLLIEDGKLLLEKRAEDKATDPGLNAIPGGHIERGESQIQALFREVKEELDVTPKTYQFLCSLYHPTKELQLIHYYVVNAWEGALRSLEAETVEWYPVSAAPIDIRADQVALCEYQRVSRYL